MQRRELILGLLLTGLSACAAPSGRIGPDGLPLPQVYRIKPEDEAQIPFRMLDAVNTLRRALPLDTKAERADRLYTVRYDTLNKIKEVMHTLENTKSLKEQEIAFLHHQMIMKMKILRHMNLIKISSLMSM